jgi:hypothetical protein
MGAYNSKEENCLENLHHNHLIPIKGYEKLPLVSLESAVKPLISLLPEIQTYVHTTKQKCINPADGLTQDQSASIMLCTMTWQPYNQCLSIELNSVLNSTDREKLKPWFLYLKLLLTALSRLPSIHRIVYRGNTSDVSQYYPTDQTIIWWDFSLCTTSIDMLHSEKDLQTIFTIECNSSKDISKHLFTPTKDMILLLPATQFQVIKCSKEKSNLHWIHLKEIQSPFALLQFVSNVLEHSRINYVNSVPFIIPSSPKKQHNHTLEESIVEYPSNSSIHLKLKQISNNDMKVIVQQAIITKNCTELWLNNAQITSQGALILSNSLFNNTTLKKLYLNDNSLHDRGVHCLSRILSINNSTLKDLHLARNGITSKGTQYLSDMLNTNKTLTTLSLFGNKIDDDGIKCLTHVLTVNNSTLECLYLSGNNSMTDLSIDYFIDMLKQNYSLKKLHLFNCNLSDIGKRKLREKIQRKKHFKLYV